MEIKDIILVLLVIIVIYLIYKVSFGLNNEKFSTPPNNSDILQAINDRYKINLDNLRKLGDISNEMLKTDTTTLSSTNIKLVGDLEVDGNITFNKNNSNMIEIYPQYMIISWAIPDLTNTALPKGWAPCDGSKYNLGPDGTAVKTDGDGIQTPDLRGRIILGHVPVNSKIDSDSYDGGDISKLGGSYSFTLTNDYLDQHQHYCFTQLPNNINMDLSNNYSPSYTKNSDDLYSYTLWGGPDPTINKSSVVGNNIPIIIQPPSYVLIFIMKI